MTYIVEEFPLVRKITVKGNEMYSDRAIREIFVMKEDETYREDLMDAARTGLLEFYGRKGFAGTEVDISVEASDKKGWVDILIQVEEGTPVIINKIEASIEVRYLLSLTEGDRIDRDKLDKDMAAIVKHYKEKNYVSPSAGPYSFKEGILRMPVSKGTRLELDFKGNTVFSDKKLREKLTFIENEDVSDVTITEAADRIKRRYISNGYYHANVAAVVTRKDEVIGIKFVIYEGEKVVLRKILLSGITINPETLIKPCRLRKTSLLIIIC